MRIGRVVFVAAFAAALEVACAGKHAAPAPPETARTLVVLLPDSDTGVTGRAFVTNKVGTTDLDATRDSSTASPSTHSRRCPPLPFTSRSTSNSNPTS